MRIIAEDVFSGRPILVVIENQAYSLAQSNQPSVPGVYLSPGWVDIQVNGFAGVNLFALGVTFNYLVSLFHHDQVRQGLFGRPILKQPLDRHFWWMGLLAMLAGLGLGLASFILALGDWPITRLWL